MVVDIDCESFLSVDERGVIEVRFPEGVLGEGAAFIKGGVESFVFEGGAEEGESFSEEG